MKTFTAPLDFLELLLAHKQRFQNSCTTSARELILKIHGKVDPGFYGFQDKYQNGNKGFSPLDEELPYGITIQNRTKPIKEAYSDVESELKAGYFPLISIPFVRGASVVNCEEHCGPFHIWIAGPSIAGGQFSFYSPNDRNFPGYTVFHDPDYLCFILEKMGPYQLNYATYRFQESEDRKDENNKTV